MCLILLNERSSDVSSVKASRPFIWAIKLSYKSRSCRVGAIDSGNSTLEI